MNDIVIDLPPHSHDCVRLTGGFSGEAGSFSRLSLVSGDLMHLGETLTVSAERGVRLREARVSFAKNLFRSKPIEIGLTVYGQQFNYNQAQESSILAFDRRIAEFNTLNPDDLIRYVRRSYGGTASAAYRLRSHIRLGMSYTYDVSNVHALTGSTAEWFGVPGPVSYGGANLIPIYNLPPPPTYFNFLNSEFSSPLSNVRTGKLTPSFVYDSVDNPLKPSRGTLLSTSLAIAGIGGNINTIEPVLDAKQFLPGLVPGHVIALHFHGSVISGYGNKNPPLYERYYMGGEDEVRGFDSWSVGPMVFEPATASVPVLNNDGTPRMQKMIDANGNVTLVNVTQTIPAYRVLSPGGDVKVFINAEYRIPLFGPFTLALFGDAGINKAQLSGQLALNPSRINQLESQFPAAAFKNQAVIAPATEKIRTSIGAELQVNTPVIKTPVRFYWAYNPAVFRGNLFLPIAADRSYFPNPLPFSKRKTLSACRSRCGSDDRYFVSQSGELFNEIMVVPIHEVNPLQPHLCRGPSRISRLGDRP